jgi:VCBS repeat-containing protein
VLANDTDPDIHDILTLSAVNGSASLIAHAIKGIYGTLTLAADGSYTYVMKNNAPVGAQDVFQYTVSDGHGGTSISTLTLQIPYPALAISSATLTGSVNERSLVTGSGANDTISAQVIAYNVPDPNNRPTASIDKAHQTVTWQDNTHDYTAELNAPQKAALVAAQKNAFAINQTDTANTGKVTWTYKIADSTLDFLGANETLTVTTPILIDDHHGNVVTENVVVTISGADDKPKVSAPITSTASENDASYTIDLLQFASDPDTHDILHVASLTGLAAGVTLVGDTLQVDPNAYNSLSVGQHATVDVRYSVADGTGNSVQERATITINGANDAPTAVPDTVQTGTKVTGNVLTNDVDPDAHDTLHVNAVSFGNAGSIISPGHPATIDGSYGTLTLRSDGTYSYLETSVQIPSGALDVFNYSIDDGHGGGASSTLTVQFPNAGLLNAAAIFEPFGPSGEIAVLATLAQDAYHLAPTETEFAVGQGKNVAYDFPEHLFAQGLPAGMRLLTTADLPLGLQNVPDTDFPTSGLEDGIYHNGNAAALVARSADSLFLAFRGTNDDPGFNQALLSHFNGGTPDSNDWFSTAEQNYYSLLAPLFTAIDNYTSAHPEIHHVYVTGHSLGGGVAQEFMATHVGPGYNSSLYEAVTFGSIGFSSFATNQDDARITNIHITGDPSIHVNNQRGDDYQIIDFNGVNNLFNTADHHMELYYSAAQFLSMDAYAVPASSLKGNGQYDQTTIVADIANNGSPTALNPWTVTLPGGAVEGTSGNDIIQAKPGFNILVGDAGSDTFVFTRNVGTDVIADFQPGKDVLQLDHSLFANANAALHAVTYGFDSQAGVPVATIQVDASDSITLNGIVRGLLHTTDFHIV